MAGSNKLPNGSAKVKPSPIEIFVIFSAASFNNPFGDV